MTDFPSPSASLPEGVTRSASRRRFHEFVQPLNVIAMTAANIRMRTANFPSEEAEYVLAKLERIERQVEKATALAEKLFDEIPDSAFPAGESR